MTLDLSKLSALEGAKSYEVEEFFSENPGFHPNNLIADKCHEATKALLTTRAVNGHTHYRGFAPALITVIHGSDCKETLQLYLNHAETNPNFTDSDGKTPLHLAVALQNHDAIAELINSDKVDPNLQDNSGNTALHLAALQGDLKAVELLLSNKKKKLELLPNKGGFTAVDYAKTNDVLNRLRKYSEYISTIKALNNQPEDKLNEPDTTDLTPLHWAVADEDVQGVKELLAHGIKITKTSKGHTPLDYAIAIQNDEIAGLISDYILSSEKKVTQKVNACRELVLYTNPPAKVEAALSAQWALLNRSIEQLISKVRTIPGTEKASTLTLPSFPPVKLVPPAITSGVKVEERPEAETPEAFPKEGSPVARVLDFKPVAKVLDFEAKSGTGLPPEQLQMVRYVPLNGNGTVAVYTPNGAHIKAALAKGAKKAAWFTCSTAYYALGIIPALALATKLYFVAQSYFDFDGSDALHEDCLAASLDSRSFYDVWSPAPQSYVDCMGAGL